MCRNQQTSSSEVKKRREQYGENRLRAKKSKSNWERFAEQFKDVMILILLAAAAISFVVACVEGDPEGRYAIVATTRPETIMGDTAMCINPNDPKNTWLKGRSDCSVGKPCDSCDRGRLCGYRVRYRLSEGNSGTRCERHICWAKI